ncbi:MAG: GNAT family N-acetyltransferase [Bryobacterales bacterium]|jgi:ribosomal-protein-alanine N-acetyltransferase|nr:GNAT family N-acetyltransferase [Bryobacterales bacterium]
MMQPGPSIDGVEIRNAAAAHLPLVEALFAACPQATPWKAAALADYPLLVALPPSGAQGFLAAAALARVLAPGEAELLNIAVHSAFRRRGLAEALIRRLFLFSPGNWFLEVRQSNASAIHLYEKIGFSRLGTRPRYYSDSGEDAIVMGCTAW